MNTQFIEQLANNQRKISEAWLAIANQNFALGEKLTNITLEMLRGNMERFAQQSQALVTQKDPQAAWQEVQKFVTSNVEELVNQQRQVAELLKQHRNELSKVAEEQINAINKEIAELLDNLAKSAPAGSEVAINAAKSALAATSAAYENIQKAFQQVNEIVEANLFAAANAATKAVSTAAQTAQKAQPAAGAKKSA
ncbi:MAG TPA: phasin family protein [Hydrogenophilus thermoluteolus]|nr:phasin family protein [Hydrogenophilus thermoluteolus]